VYLPPNYRHLHPPYPYLLLFDGQSYLHDMFVRTILDNLITAGEIPPLVAVLLNSPNRARDLALYPPFLDFLERELNPWLHTHYHVTRDPRKRVVGGQSLGGLAAIYTGLQLPHLFGNILSQSGGVFWSAPTDPEPNWLARQFATTPRRALRLYLEVGSMEREPTWNNGPSQLEAHHLLVDTLLTRRYVHHYHEYHGDHHVICWRHTFANALRWLLSSSAAPV
jgi:enterochelin esterase family protein